MWLTHWGRDKMVKKFSDDIFKSIFLNENVWISINISLKFVPKGPINNIPALVQIMAWRRAGDKPLSEPMMVRLPTDICITLPPCGNLPQTMVIYKVFVVSILKTIDHLIAKSIFSKNSNRHHIISLQENEINCFVNLECDLVPAFVIGTFYAISYHCKFLLHWQFIVSIPGS